MFQRVTTKGEAAALIAVGVHVRSTVRSVVRVSNALEHHSLPIADLVTLVTTFNHIAVFCSLAAAREPATLDGVGVHEGTSTHALEHDLHAVSDLVSVLIRSKDSPAK